MSQVEHAVVTAHFLAGDRVELTAIDALPPADPEDGDAEYYRLRAILRVARLIKRGCPHAEMHVAD
jgi:hypothetical protein